MSPRRLIRLAFRLAIHFTGMLSLLICVALLVLHVRDVNGNGFRLSAGLENRSCVYDKFERVIHDDSGRGVTTTTEIWRHVHVWFDQDITELTYTHYVSTSKCSVGDVRDWTATGPFISVGWDDGTHRRPHSNEFIRQAGKLWEGSTYEYSDDSNPNENHKWSSRALAIPWHAPLNALSVVVVLWLAFLAWHALISALCRWCQSRSSKAPGIAAGAAASDASQQTSRLGKALGTRVKDIVRQAHRLPTRGFRCMVHFIGAMSVLICIAILVIHRRDLNGNGFRMNVEYTNRSACLDERSAEGWQWASGRGPRVTRYAQIWLDEGSAELRFGGDTPGSEDNLDVQHMDPVGSTFGLALHDYSYRNGPSTGPGGIVQPWFAWSGSRWDTDYECGVAVPWYVPFDMSMAIATGWGVILALPMLRRIRRRRRISQGLCVACAYDLRGSPANAACPECGAVQIP